MLMAMLFVSHSFFFCVPAHTQMLAHLQRQITDVGLLVIGPSSSCTSFVRAWHGQKQADFILIKYVIE